MIAFFAGAFTFFGVACVDLFHSTGDVKSLCETDALDPKCTDAPPPVEICAPDGGVAQQRAIHACAWLAACGHPIGRNKTGECMVDAILAYDCAANPNRQAKGEAKAFWNCMQNANSCAAVGYCIFPSAGGVACKNGTFVGCEQNGNVDIDTRLDCTQAGPGGGENCAPHGQTCSSLDPDAANNSALCVGPQRRACTGSVGCVDGGLSLCDDAGVDLGYSCANVGAGTCNPSGATPACEPQTEGGTCSPTNDVTCTAGSVRAQGCVTLAPESVDCTPISGPGTCVPIEAGAPGTVPSDACRVADAGCTDDTCDNEAGALVACVRGRPVAIDCTKQGLKSCQPITTAEGLVPACNP
ncbi:MAG TPA: hypothetical protein VGH87_20940 [Polyangiaceae bacterium]